MDSTAITLLAAIIPILLLMLWQGHLDRKLIRTEIKAELKEVKDKLDQTATKAELKEVKDKLDGVEGRLTQVQTDVAYMKGQLNPVEPEPPSSQPPPASRETVEVGTPPRI